MLFQILNRWSGKIQFECVIEESQFDERWKIALRLAISAKADLRDADLRGADLYGANLYDADLYGADLRGADLRCANLYGANLYGADLYGANLYGADLYGANLYGADLRCADLRRANLRGADLYGADLYGANLYGADLYGADLRCASLRGAKNADLAKARTAILPEGDIIGWKKLQNGVIAKLLIPNNAKRSNATGRKCRAEFAKVVELFGGDIGLSNHDGKTKYIVGETVYPDSFDDDRFNECAPGIHFFITRIEAENY